MRSLSLLSAALLAAALSACSPPAPNSASGAAAHGPRPVSAQRDWILGPQGAPISLIVYSDAECPFCKEYAGTPEEVAALYNGAVNVVLRHFPLERHGQAAIDAAIATECLGAIAGPNAAFSFFYGYMGASLGDGKGLPGGSAALASLASAHGAPRFDILQRCMADPVSAARVQEDILDARAAGVTGTPATVVRSNISGETILVKGGADQKTISGEIQKMVQSSLAALPPSPASAQTPN